MLQVLVSGAGISGLTAAVSLRRAGHAVHIYERSSMSNEIGAAINVPPNATRFLTAWGLDPAASRFVKAQRSSYQDPFTLEKTASLSTAGSIEKTAGAELYLAHRVDLHNALKWMATRLDGPGVPVVVHLASEVVAYDPYDPSMTLASGERIKGDVIICADGIHSVGCDTVLGRAKETIAPKYSNCAYRFLISSSTLEDDPETRFFNENREGWTRLYPHDSTRRRLVTYPCRDNLVHNFVGIVYDEKRSSGEKEDWQATVDASEVLDWFSDYHPDLLKVISKATEVKRWPLLYREPIGSWCKGRMALAGDAAHPMLPHQGQGGAQGMEDGLVLGIVLHGAVTAADIKARLAIYQEVRRSRASVIQILSNVGQNQSGLVKDELAEFMPEEKQPKSAADNYKFNFAYDVVRHTLEAMKKLDGDFSLPEDFFESEVLGVPEEE